MPSWLFNMICALIFAAPIGEGILLVWPLFIGREHPGGLGADMVALVVAALLAGAGLMAAMSLSQRGRRQWF